MLYALHELHKTITAPLVAWADASHRLFHAIRTARSPTTPLSRTIAASQRSAGASDALLREAGLGHRPRHASEATRGAGQHRAGARRNPSACCCISARRCDNPGPKLLIFAPLSGHHRHSAARHRQVRRCRTSTSTSPTGSTRAWCRLAAGPFHLDDYVDYCKEFIRLLGPEAWPHASDSVCQPTVPVLAAMSLLAQAKDPALPKTMVMMGGPIDPRRNPTVVNEFAMGRSHAWFEDQVIHRVPFNYPGFMRRVYPGFLQHLGFIAMNADRHIDAHRKFFNHLIVGDGDSASAHRRFYDEYNAVLDMPAEYYLDTIKVVFQEFALAQGQDDGARRAGAPRGHPDHRAVHHRGRARRHLRQRPDRGRPHLCAEHPVGKAQASAGQGRGPLRDLQRTQVPRADLPADPRFHPALGTDRPSAHPPAPLR